MRIAIPKERAAHEARVALVPESVSKLVKAGIDVVVEAGAGAAASFPDAQYTSAGAKVVADYASCVAGADLICKVQPPAADETAAIPEGAAVICYLQPAVYPDAVQRLNGRKASALALELVPRITRAQSMDVLSSQATISGYRAVLLGAGALGRLMPMLSTAAGTLAPAKVFVLGAGVAGLQAIATARRLGAIVSGFDVRPAAREQILSLGAAVLKVEGVADAEGAGGYAREQTEEEKQKTQAAIKAHLAQMDLVITTAAIPGRKAPVLVTQDALEGMKPGAVIVDLAAETGGNVVGTKSGETVVLNGVTVLGPVNVPSQAAFHASQMLSRNIHTLLQHILTEGKTLNLDANDEITGAMLVCQNGTVRV
ncbi:MAG: NAD(P) transhydrogenase subunit alpha [Gemmatimonadaceae bacterium]|nr:NAD(P) transhydrogenase subunit alpha [Gemmatimonadaceae bacterium]